MDFRKFVTLCVVLQNTFSSGGAKADIDAFTESSQRSYTSKQYGMKEVVMYLTPSELRALEDAKVLIRADENGVPEFMMNQHNEQSKENKHPNTDQYNFHNEDNVKSNNYNKDDNDFKNYFQNLFHSKYENNVKSFDQYKPTYDVEEPNQEQEPSFSAGLQAYRDDSLTEKPTTSVIPPPHTSYAYIKLFRPGESETDIRLFYPNPYQKEIEKYNMQHHKKQDYNADFNYNQKQNIEDFSHYSDKEQEGYLDELKHSLVQKPWTHSYRKRNPVLKFKRVFRNAQRRLAKS